MTDSNNVVIKINYKGSGNSPYRRTENDMVTEWHYQRIVIAVILIMVFIVFPFYYFSDDSAEQPVKKLTSVTKIKPVANNILKAVDKEVAKLEQVKEVETDVNTIINNPVKVIKKEQTAIEIKPVNKNPAEKIKKEEIIELKSNSSHSLVDKKIVRALLTTGVNNKEPLGIIVSPVLVNENQALSVFYFTEIVDMKGLAVYHRWVWNNKVIYNRKINILGDRWRASTSKLIPYSKTGDWSVRLVNNEGIVLNEIKFKVIP